MRQWISAPAPPGRPQPSTTRKPPPARPSPGGLRYLRDQARRLAADPRRASSAVRVIPGLRRGAGPCPRSAAVIRFHKGPPIVVDGVDTRACTPGTATGSGGPAPSWHQTPPRLAAALRPVTLRAAHPRRSQRNVLLHHELPPAIIDFSPYWRPAASPRDRGYRCLVWEDADARLWPLPPLDDFGQYLIRALIFRIVTIDNRRLSATCRPGRRRPVGRRDLACSSSPVLNRPAGRSGETQRSVGR